MIVSIRKRALLMSLYDFLAIIFSYIIGLIIRFDLDINEAMKYKSALISAVAIAIIIHFIVFEVFNIRKTVWRYISVDEAIRIVSAVFVANLSTLLFTSTFFALGFPRSVYVIAGFFICALMLGIRIVYRYLRLKRKINLKSENAIIIGAGDAGNILAKELAVNDLYDYRVVGFVDDAIYKKNRTINGYNVLGNTDDLTKIKEKHNITMAFIAMPSSSKQQVKNIIDKCKKIQLPVKIMGLNEVGNIDKNVIRNISINDLLGRGQITLDNHGISDYISDKVIMVTGGGGSIGSELIRQIVKFKPKKIVCFDIYENNMYTLQQELLIEKRENKIDNNVELIFLIGSVRDKVRLNDVISKYKPDVLFHAAAHKHVPLVEDSPLEALKNNVFGTYNTLMTCIENKVGKFVLISTDKAVNPTNVMGATKRMCELIVQSQKDNGVTKIGAVRFGNVLGSNGSVIPLFMSQIKHGGPVRVTDKDITRYFMTIPEAARLVIQAGAYANNGDIFVLDMGEPVKILKLAEDLISLSGLKPYEDIKIEFTGLRPGEKMYEELSLSSEIRHKTENDLIFVNEPIEMTKEMVDKKLLMLSSVILNSNEVENINNVILNIIL